MKEYVVYYRPVGSMTLEVGPYRHRLEAERAMTALAARSDIRHTADIRLHTYDVDDECEDEE